MQTLLSDRAHCYRCYRPKSSCMCGHIRPILTQTTFVILMHPKEFRKTKNGTGHLTHLSLPNSERFVGINFTHHARVNEIIATHESFVLYPSAHALNLSRENPRKTLHVNKPMAIFLIDSTWACSLKMMRESQNLRGLSHISFDATKCSEFKIKEQPKEYCLSTIESTLTVLELLNRWQIERLTQEQIALFLTPFHAMIAYQLGHAHNVRFRPNSKGVLTPHDLQQIPSFCKN